jgi:hypothetical protein
MPLPSLARDFFDRIVNATDPVAAIRKLIDLEAPTFETDWLDFKGEPDNPMRPNPKQRDGKVRELWSEALGGFANNQGGVLIWGIDARKTETPRGEIDAAIADKPVSNPIALKSRLIELQRGATDPPLANVLVEGYEIPGSAGDGYVICCVPEGPFKPYRSEQAGQQYYLRAGDSTKPMSRAVLAAMFYPRTRPIFRVGADLSWVLPDETYDDRTAQTRMDMTIWLQNVGTATAKNLLIRLAALNLKPHPGTKDLRPAWGWGQSPWDVYAWEHPLLHPGVPPRKVFDWAWPTPATYRHRAQGNAMVPICEDPTFDFTVYAEDQQPQSGSVRFDMEELTRFRRQTVELTLVETDRGAPLSESI